MGKRIQLLVSKGIVCNVDDEVVVPSKCHAREMHSFLKQHYKGMQDVFCVMY